MDLSHLKLDSTNTRAEIKKEGISGKGTFTTSFIAKGEIILATVGKKILVEEFDFLVPPNLITYCFQIDKLHFLCPVDEKSLNGMFLVNHSCNPNCGIYKNNSLIAMRDIETSEEITFDYACCDAEYPGIPGAAFSTFQCQCHTSECRNVITGKDYQRKDLQNKYKGYFSEYIQDLISD